MKVWGCDLFFFLLGWFGVYTEWWKKEKKVAWREQKQQAKDFISKENIAL